MRKAMRARTSKKPRVTPLDRRAAATMQQYAHAATQDITRQQHVLSAVIDSRDDEIAELMMRLAEAKVNRAKAEAALEGLTRVVAKRA